MDINEILMQAKKNQKETSTVNRYNTNVKPAKKLSRTVNPAAVKALLDKKKKDEIKNSVHAVKQKEELQKLRTESKTAKKANSMAKRTKDNLKVYRGEDVLGLYPEPKKKRRRRGGPPSPPPLSPEQDKRHKAFMKNIVPKVKVPGVNDDDSDDDYRESVLEQDDRKMRKLEKNRNKARTAANLEFNDLLQLAEKHKNKVEESSSSSDGGSDSGEESDGSTDKYGRPLTAEEKYQRERRKRRELEERLKAASSAKHPPSSSKHEHNHKTSSSNSLANFKIAKLNSGMSDEAKRARVRDLMKKFNGSATQSKTSDKKHDQTTSSKQMHKSHSTPSLSSLKHKKRSEENIKNKHKHDRVKGESSKGHSKDSKHHRSLTPNPKMPPKQTSAIPMRKEKLKPPRPSSDSEMRQTKIDSHLKPKIKAPGSSERALSSNKSRTAVEKITSNPYKHTVVKQSTQKKPAADALVDPWSKARKEPSKKSRPPPPTGKCTLSVTSEAVHTNWPNTAREDPFIQAYKKTGKVIPKLTPEVVAHYKAVMMEKLRREGKIPPSNRRQPPQKRRYGVIGDDSEDEYDSDMEGFIVSEPEDEELEDENVDISSHIKAIFGYDKSKYGRESEWELSRMDASYKDIEREEKKSLRIAKEEDAREAKLEEERMNRTKKKKKT